MSIYPFDIPISTLHSMTFCLKSGAIVTITHQETIPQSNYKVTKDILI